MQARWHRCLKRLTVRYERGASVLVLALVINLLYQTRRMPSPLYVGRSGSRRVAGRVSPGTRSLTDMLAPPASGPIVRRLVPVGPACAGLLVYATGVRTLPPCCHALRQNATDLTGSDDDPLRRRHHSWLEDRRPSIHGHHLVQKHAVGCYVTYLDESPDAFCAVATAYGRPEPPCLRQADGPSPSAARMRLICCAYETRYRACPAGLARYGGCCTSAADAWGSPNGGAVYRARLQDYQWSRAGPLAISP